MNKIRFAIPDIGENEISKVSEVIDSRWITNGPNVLMFEKKIAEISHCTHAVAFDSCTGAMEMALRVLGIGEGDEVITTPYTYSATAEVIRNVGARIVFVDLDGKSFEMDYAKLAAAITDKTKAVIPVDIGGKLCNYRTLLAAVSCKKWIFNPNNKFQDALGRVAIIADAAHSFGAEMDGKVSGEFADFTCFSFHALKNITTGGEGGAVVWNDFKSLTRADNDGIERQFRLLGDHGQTTRDKSNGWEYDIELFGYNSIMTDIDAAMGLAQLERFDEIREKRITITQNYDKMFKTTDCAFPLIQHIGENYMSAMHLYPIELNLDYAPHMGKYGGVVTEKWRTGIYNALLEEGVSCNVHYKPLPMMTAYRNAGFDIVDYPLAYIRFASLLTIPYHTELTESEQEYIFDKIVKVVKKC